MNETLWYIDKGRNFKADIVRIYNAMQLHSVCMNVCMAQSVRVIYNIGHVAVVGLWLIVWQ